MKDGKLTMFYLLVRVLDSKVPVNEHLKAETRLDCDHCQKLSNILGKGLDAL